MHSWFISEVQKHQRRKFPLRQSPMHECFGNTDRHCSGQIRSILWERWVLGSSSDLNAHENMVTIMEEISEDHTLWWYWSCFNMRFGVIWSMLQNYSSIFWYISFLNCRVSTCIWSIGSTEPSMEMDIAYWYFDFVWLGCFIKSKS